jgi:methionine aminopeptidase
MSGRDYVPSAQARLAEGDIFTVDLSPSLDGRWGDCARTFHVGANGASTIIQEGIDLERQLHGELADWATTETTFDALFRHMNARIVDCGYENLDFAGNLGHTIERSREERLYTEAGNMTRLGEVSLFTFEPHIRRPGTTIGVKHENIYFFDTAGVLTEL